MPLDPIHTIRKSKRLHLKDGVFLTLAPPGVFEGHLRAVEGRVAWVGGASAVERGEEVLECWRQPVMPGLAIAGVDPLETAARAFPSARAAAAREELAKLPEEDQQTLATQAFVECAALGVLAPIVDLRGASAARARGTVAALAEVGLRGLLEIDGDPAEVEALARGLGAGELVRAARPSAAPRASILGIARGERIDPDSWLSAAGGPPDVLGLVRLLEQRERGLGFRCLANTFQALTAAFGAPFGALVRGAWFDAVFLDYEPAARLDANNVEAFLTSSVGPWCVEAAAVATNPVIRRHEVLTADRAAVAHRIAEIVAAIGGRSPGGTSAAPTGSSH